MDINVLFLGKCKYKRALEIQYQLLEKRQNKEIGDTLILVEHPPVITMGRRAESTNIVGPSPLLKEEGIEIFEANRGGDVTYHGPGQLVGYPIVDIRSFPIGIRDFVGKLEEIFIKLLKNEFNIEAGREEEHTGVWIEGEKIVAIGLAVKRGVTMHGFAFNINTKLEHFRFIIPCGITDKGVTSIEKLKGTTINFDEAVKLIPKYYSKEFGYKNINIVDIESLQLEVM